MKKKKIVLKENKYRILYKIEHIYNEVQSKNLGHEKYEGFYVENKNPKKVRALAFRYKTFTNDIQTIEDSAAYEKALHCFEKGFSF